MVINVHRRLGNKHYSASMRKWKHNRSIKDKAVQCQDYHTYRLNSTKWRELRVIDLTNIAAKVVFRVESPDAQWSSSFDPIETSPDAWYGRFFRPASAATPRDMAIPYTWPSLPEPVFSRRFYTLEAARSNPSELSNGDAAFLGNESDLNTKNILDYVISFLSAITLRGVPVPDSEVVRVLTNVPSYVGQVDKLKRDVMNRIAEMIRSDYKREGTFVYRYPAIANDIAGAIAQLLGNVRPEQSQPPSTGSNKRRSDDDDADDNNIERSRKRIANATIRLANQSTGMNKNKRRDADEDDEDYERLRKRSR